MSFDALETAKGIKETKGKLEYELDWQFITDMAQRMAENKTKYGKNNWQKPIDIEQLKQSLFRHVIAVMKDDITEDHLSALSCNAMMIAYQLRK